MRFVFNSRRGSRIAAVIAISSVIALVSCDEPTAPEANVARAPASIAMNAQANNELSQFGNDMDEMTGWSLVNLPDSRGHMKLVGILNSLSAHLIAGQIDACQQDVNDARSFLGELTENEQVELGGIGVTLDVVQNALDKSK